MNSCADAQLASGGSRGLGNASEHWIKSLSVGAGSNCPVEELGICTVMESQGWARGADGGGVCFGADAQTLQRKLSVSHEVPLTWLFSQHQFPWWRAEH